MAKKKRKNTRPTSQPTSLMFPELHDDVSAAVAPHLPQLRFNNSNTNSNATRKWSTNVMGRFTCAAGHIWTSKKIAIIIRKYTYDEYNAEVFSQLCRACEELGRMSLDEESYVERVAYRLKVWAGVQVKKPQRCIKAGTPPHDSERCEGCKRGVCKEGGDGAGFFGDW